MKFTFEEINLICIYDTGDRLGLIADIRGSLPHVYDMELRGIMETVIAKLEGMADVEFDAIDFVPADDSNYDDDMEG